MIDGTLRHLLAVTFLGVVLVLAGLLARGWSTWWLLPLLWLGEFQLFHIVAHFSIFAGIVLLVAPHTRSAIWLWALILAGGVLVEFVQIAAGGFILTRPLLHDCLFDVLVDMTGAAVSWLGLWVRQSLRCQRDSAQLAPGGKRYNETMNS